MDPGGQESTGGQTETAMRGRVSQDFISFNSSRSAPESRRSPPHRALAKQVSINARRLDQPAVRPTLLSRQGLIRNASFVETPVPLVPRFIDAPV